MYRLAGVYKHLAPLEPELRLIVALLCRALLRPLPATKPLDALEELPAVLVRCESCAVTLRQLPLTTLYEFSFSGNVIAKTCSGTADAQATVHENAGANAAGESGI